MILFDGLFGRVELPEWARPILQAPEVQRLRDIRLINTSSPYMPALSDARRFTHTIGVTYLANSTAKRLNRDHKDIELRSLVAAAIVHDVGSPPFGHLFEYLLKSTSGWSHEEALRWVIRGEYRPDNIYHQIYYGRPLGLLEAFERAAVDERTVEDLVLGGATLGGLIAGTLDLDNIDNVFRMASLLGMEVSVREAEVLASCLCITDGSTVVSARGATSLAMWRELRRKSYEYLAFDTAALAGQAMLTESISAAISLGMLSEEQWFWTDEELLRRLCSPRTPKEVRLPAQRFAVADYYACMGVLWYNQALEGKEDLRRPTTRRILGEALSSALGVEVVPYIFYDNGTFEKPVHLGSSDGMHWAEVGARSVSTIASIFTPRRRTPKRDRERIVAVLEAFGLPAAKLIPQPGRDLDDYTQQLPF